MRDTNEASGQADDLETLQRAVLGYFLRFSNPNNGLIADSSRDGAPCSIAATGLGLSAYVVGVERGFMTRGDAARRTLAALRFFKGSLQSEDPEATGFRGFYYHFLDMETGKRVWESELSTIDTAILIAGVLTSGMYFTAAVNDEAEIRDLARFLYDRIEWPWATDCGPVVRMGWTPRAGFLSYGWEGFSEAILLYVLGLGSSTHPLPAECYHSWTGTYHWENLYDIDFLFASPLFTHQLSHTWIDFRGIQDAFMREKRSDYFENSRRATVIQQQYALRNPLWFKGYSEDCWGITAGQGPGFAKQRLEGEVTRQFYGYEARGVPFGPDDGTLAPWAAAASLPFAPEAVLACLRHFQEKYPQSISSDGLLTSINPSFDIGGGVGEEKGYGVGRGWVAPEHLGLDQGPVALMIENHASGLIWRLTRECPAMVTGLRRAGFQGGWLGSSGL